MKFFFRPEQKGTGYHPGPVAPPTADGASLQDNSQTTARQQLTSASKTNNTQKSDMIRLFAVYNTCNDERVMNVYTRAESLGGLIGPIVRGTNLKGKLDGVLGVVEVEEVEGLAPDDEADRVLAASRARSALILEKARC